MNSSSTEAKTDNALKSDSYTADSSKSANIPDIEAMMKLMQVMKTTNQSSPSKELLQSLKPFLNDSRKEKVDQYIKVLGITKILEAFNEFDDKSKK